MSHIKKLRFAPVLAVLLSLVVLTGTSPAPAVAEHRHSPHVDILPPVAPKVVLAGMRVPVVTGVTNRATTVQRVKIQASAWCVPWITWFGKKKKELIPPSNTPSMTYNPAPERYVVRMVKIPEYCGKPDPRSGITTTGGRIDVSQFGPYGQVWSTFEIGKPFTLRNIRYNLKLKDPGPKPSQHQAHHTLPQKFADFFKKAGINIHDPVNLVWWCSKPGLPTNHPANARAYNQRWSEWIRANRSASKKAILAFRDLIFDEYIYDC